jgi:hypothetical protein
MSTLVINPFTAHRSLNLTSLRIEGGREQSYTEMASA